MRTIAILLCLIALPACGSEIADVECTSNDECAPGLMCIGGDCRRGDQDDAGDDVADDAIAEDDTDDAGSDTEAPDVDDDATDAGDDVAPDATLDATDGGIDTLEEVGEDVDPPDVEDSGRDAADDVARDPDTRDTSDAFDATADTSDTSDAADATDAADTADAADGSADTTDASDAADASDTDDAGDVADATADTTDAADAADASDADDATDATSDATDTADATDASSDAADTGGCVTDDVCGGEQICVDGACVAPECSCSGEVCLLDDECDVFTQVCDAGRCVEAPCDTHLFTFDPGIETFGVVHVAGEFNASDGAWPSTVGEGGWPLVWHETHGLWLGRFEVGIGRWLYKLVLDESGSWIDDPTNPDRELDGFGGFNSVLTVFCPDGPGLCGESDAFDWRDVVLYHVMVDRFYDSDGVAVPVPGATDGDATMGPSAQYEGGDLAGVTARVDYLAELGASGLWISAPYDARDDVGSGDAIGAPGYDYSGYHGFWPSPGDIDLSEPGSAHPMVESRIGTDADLHAMVDAAHAADVPSGHGMRVLFGYSPRGVDADSDLYLAHPTWFTDHGRPAPRLCGPEGLWGDPFWGTRCWFAEYLAVFDPDEAAARSWVVDDAAWWVDTYGIDGLFLDAVTQLDTRILEELRVGIGSIEGSGPRARLTLLGQTYTFDDRAQIASRVDPADALDGQFDFPLKARLCEALFRSEGSLAALAEWLDTNDAYYGADALMMPSIGNADVPRAIHFASGEITNCREGSYLGNSWTDFYDQPTDTAAYERLALAFAVILTQPGMPVIYYGDEIGLAGGGDPDNRRMMPWDDADLLPAQLQLRASVTALLRARAEYRVLSRGERVTLAASDDTWVYVMSGCDGTSPDVTVALNRAETSRTVTVPPGSYVDVLTGADDSGGALLLPPRSFVVLVPR